MGFTNALGIAGLKTGVVTNTGTVANPYDGQVVYETDNNDLKAYNGSSWDVMNGGLVLVKSQTIGSGVSSVSVTGAFSSTYDNYKVLISGGVASTTLELRMTLGASSTGYYIAGNGIGFTGAAYNLYQSNAAYWTAGVATTNAINFCCELINPYLAKYTYFLNGTYVGTAGSNELNGFHGVATSYTDFTLTTSTGTLTGGEIRVYGYTNS